MCKGFQRHISFLNILFYLWWDVLSEDFNWLPSGIGLVPFPLSRGSFFRATPPLQVELLFDETRLGRRTQTLNPSRFLWNEFIKSNRKLPSHWDALRRGPTRLEDLISVADLRLERSTAPASSSRSSRTLVLGMWPHDAPRPGCTSPPPLLVTWLVTCGPTRHRVVFMSHSSFPQKRRHKVGQADCPTFIQMGHQTTRQIIFISLSMTWSELKENSLWFSFLLWWVLFIHNYNLKSDKAVFVLHQIINLVFSSSWFSFLPKQKEEEKVKFSFDLKKRRC